MCHHEGIFSKMNVVIYYSNTGESKKIAEFLAEKTGFSLLQVEEAEKGFYWNVILVFPVYCQNIPAPVKNFLRQLSAEYLTLVATYGRMCCGNVLYEAQRLATCALTVAAAYVPTKHSYLQEDSFKDYEQLMPLVEKLKNEKDLKLLKIPRSYKNSFANFAKGWRSRVGVKMWRDENCTHCGKCEKGCAQKGIVSGKTNKNCIRCMKCVVNCPVSAIRVTNRLPMRLYLKKKKIDKLVLYI